MKNDKFFYGVVVGEVADKGDGLIGGGWLTMATD